MYWIALGALVPASIADWRSREIPDGIPGLLFVTALVCKFGGVHPSSWGDIALGAGMAFGTSVVLFARGGLGGGDVKLLMALGAALGFDAFVPFLVSTALLGGVVALAARRLRVSEIPYAPVMLAGLLVWLPLVAMQR